MPTDRPYMRWFPRDWLGDPAVRAVSSAARGLWIDMLCLMYESPKIGHLEHASGCPVDAAQLARMTGNDPTETQKSLAELEACGVFSRNGGGTIYSRRMVKDDAIYRAAVEFGKTGGNPALKPREDGGVNPTLNPSAKGGVRATAQASECRMHIQNAEDIMQKTETDTPKPPGGAGDKVLDELKARIGKLFNRRETTAWDDKELEKLKKIAKRPGVLDEMAEVEQFFATSQYHRKGIQTLLNNWGLELDRARTEANKPHHPTLQEISDSIPIPAGGIVP